jgi:D-alanyl-D-alanine carboxypeptidase (penicillin-binding protein 5/6)
LIVAALGFILGAIYVWVVKPGLPYDEPSHWSTVLYYADHRQLPVLGHPGVTYEAQMGPVAYVVDAFVVHLARAAGLSASVAFHLVRLVGAAELCAAVVLAGRLMRRLLGRSWSVAAAVAFLALNPMLLTMSSSVQNDTLALALGLLALELALGRLSDRPTLRSAFVVGAVAGVAVLTKLTAWVAVIAVAAWLIWRHRRGGLQPLAAFIGAVVAISGWWFIRNIDLYGDPTAAAGVRRSGVSFGAYHVHGISSVAHIVEQFVTYLWLPTEYVRNFISAPAGLKGGLLAASLAAVIAGSIRARSWRKVPRWLIIGTGVLSAASWLVTYLVYQTIAPRVAYLVLPLWIGLVASALAAGLPRRPAMVGVTLLLVCLNVWTLYELSRVQSPKFIRLESKRLSIDAAQRHMHGSRQEMRDFRDATSVGEVRIAAKQMVFPSCGRKPEESVRLRGHASEQPVRSTRVEFRALAYATRFAADVAVDKCSSVATSRS